jgi:hypothetical protein
MGVQRDIMPAKRGWLSTISRLAALAVLMFFTTMVFLNIRGVCTAAGNPLHWEYISAETILDKLNIEGAVKPTTITTYKAGPSVEPPQSVHGTIEITHWLAPPSVPGDHRDPDSIWSAAAGHQRFLVEEQIKWMPTGDSSTRYFYVPNCIN